ncbi:lytic transglycosylase domain-containing protein [Rhizobium rhizogenes]
MFAGVIARLRFIPLFAEKPSHPSVPLDSQSAAARSAGQGRPTAGACALPLTEASTVAGCRCRGGGTPVRLAIPLLLGLAATTTYPVTAPAQTAPAERASPADRYADFIVEASQRFGIPVAWIRAVMRVESANDARAVSPKGAMGLMQIMPDTWADLRARYRLGTNPFDPRDNIFAGAAYLRELFDKYRSPGFLSAYNAGPGRYEEFLAGGRALPAETRAYTAQLAPVVGGEPSAATVTVAAADPMAWTRAPLFIGAVERVPAAAPAQTEAQPRDGTTAERPREETADSAQTGGLFVSRRGPCRPTMTRSRPYRRGANPSASWRALGGKAANTTARWQDKRARCAPWFGCAFSRVYEAISRGAPDRRSLRSSAFVKNFIGFARCAEPRS